LSASILIFDYQIRKMRKLEINLTEEQYQHIQEEIKYSNRIHLEGETFGGYELCLRVSVPNVFGSFLNMNTFRSIEIGEVEWEFIELSK
jgi:hypothetical protein